MVVAARLVCRICGRDEEVVIDRADRVSMTVADAHGFVVEGAEISFDGCCPYCLHATTTRENG
jgi:Fe2+ or Zn2+ uptake regulation protein